MSDDYTIKAELPELDAESTKLLKDAQTLYSDFVNARMRAGNLPGEPDNSPRGKAVEKIEKVLQKYPDDPRPNFLLGAIFHGMGELPSAEVVLTKIEELIPDNFDFHRLLAEIRLERHDYSAVDSHIDKMEKIDQTRPEIFELRAELARMKDDLSTRLSSIEKLIEIMSLDERLGVMLASTLAKMGKTDDAITKLNEFAESLPKSPEIHFNLANSLVDVDKFLDALPIYRKTLKLNPDHNMARFELADLLDELGKPEEALELYQQYIEVINEDPDGFYNAAGVAEKLDKHELVVQYYLRFLQLTDNDEDFKEVITWLNENASGNIDDGELKIALAHAYIKQEDPNSAVLLLTEARKLGHEHRRVNHLEGLAFQLLENHENAVISFKKALEFDDGAGDAGFLDDDLLIAAADSLIDLEKYPEAEETALEIIKGDEMKEDGYTLLGDILLEKNKHEDAFKQFRNALRVDMFSFDGMFGLGEVFDAREDFKSASSAFRLCLEINPDDEDAIYRLGMDYIRLGYKKWGDYYLKKYEKEFPKGEFIPEIQKIFND